MNQKERTDGEKENESWNEEVKFQVANKWNINKIKKKVRMNEREKQKKEDRKIFT